MTTQIIYDMPESEYRAHPAVSQSGLKTILDSPARYKWEKAHPRTSDAFDRGSHIHTQVLGVGDEIERLDFRDRRAKGYKDAENEAREAGKVPLIASEYDAGMDAARAVLTHPAAGPIFTPGTGFPEVSIFWTDPRTGIDLKARLDWLRPLPDGTHIIVDLKSSGKKVSPKQLPRSVADFGYDVQRVTYLDGFEEVTGERAEWLNVFVETTAPHFVTVADLSQWDERGRTLRDRALDTYQHCLETGQWPGYTDTEPALIAQPRWADYY